MRLTARQWIPDYQSVTRNGYEWWGSDNMERRAALQPGSLLFCPGFVTVAVWDSEREHSGRLTEDCHKQVIYVSCAEESEKIGDVWASPGYLLSTQSRVALAYVTFTGSGYNGY